MDLLGKYQERLKSVGKDVFIDNTVKISRPELVELGDHIALDHGFYCTVRMKLGDYIHLGPYTSVIGGEKGVLQMGHFSGTAAGCRIVCGGEDYTKGGFMGPTMPKQYRTELKISPVVYEDFVTTGTNVVVLPGIILGEGSVVGAGAVVTRDTEPWTIYVGIPARPIKERPRDKMIEYAKELGYDYSPKGLVKII